MHNQAFLEDLRPDMDSTTTFTLQTLDDGSDPQNSTLSQDATTEANLDDEVCNSGYMLLIGVRMSAVHRRRCDWRAG